jgi:hypothetical protein
MMMPHAHPSPFLRYAAPPGRVAHRPLALLLAAVLLAAATAATTGCTYINPENRYVSKWLDETVRPSSTTTRVVAAPVFIPVGIVGYLADFALINPFVQLYDTTLITRDSVWDDVDLTDFIDVALLVPRIVIYTPLTWGSVYVFRILFPFDRYEPETDHAGEDFHEATEDMGRELRRREVTR